MTLAGKLIGSTRSLQSDISGTNSATATKTFAYGNGLEKIGDTKVITNSHGDVKQLVNAAGTIIAEYAYDAFGNLLNSTGVDEAGATTTISYNDLLYASEQYDEITGIYYLRARMYSPNCGRFLEEDSYLGDGRNLYSYVGNNPLKYVDPSGHCGEKIFNEIYNIFRGAGKG